MFGIDDGYPAPPPISKNRLRKQRRFMLRKAKKMGRSMAAFLERELIKIFSETRSK